jgi:hypothetical protein
VNLGIDDNAPLLLRGLRRRRLRALGHQRHAGSESAVEKISACRHEQIPSIEWHLIPTSRERHAGYRIGADQSAGMSRHGHE